MGLHGPQLPLKEEGKRADHAAGGQEPRSGTEPVPRPMTRRLLAYDQRTASSWRRNRPFANYAHRRLN